VVEEVKASVDPEPALEKFGCGVPLRASLVRGGHGVWFWEVPDRLIKQLSDALMFVSVMGAGYKAVYSNSWVVCCLQTMCESGWLRILHNYDKTNLIYRLLSCTVNGKSRYWV